MSMTYSAGVVTAYGAAKAGGYTGTYQEFCAALGDLAAVLEDFESFSVSVTTLSPGSSATASYSDGVLTLGIPKGEKGDTGETGPQGEQGIQGETGPQGPSAYSYIDDGNGNITITEG